MRATTPPRCATWLAQRALSGPNAESLIGDLSEAYQGGRSPLWYWRQVIVAVVGGIGVEIWDQKFLIVGVLATSVYVLQWIYTSVLGPLVVLPVYRAWYPPLISWLLSKDLDGIRLVAYRVHLWGLTGTVAWCALLIVAVRAAVWLRPAERKLIASLFVISQVGMSLPYVYDSFNNWLSYRHSDPSWFFAFLDFAVNIFLIVPFSVWVGAFYKVNDNHHLIALD
jgi:hypothetical protein